MVLSDLPSQQEQQLKFRLTCRWTTPDGSIFDVAEGKRMAQEPAKLATPFERARMQRVNQAALESPLVNGYR